MPRTKTSWTEYNPAGAPMFSEHNQPKGKRGRQKGDPGIDTIIRVVFESLAQPPDEIAEKIHKMYPLYDKQWWTTKHIMVVAQVYKAMHGDTMAFNALMDRAYGKPKSTVEMNAQIAAAHIELDPKALTDDELATLLALHAKASVAQETEAEEITDAVYESDDRSLAERVSEAQGGDSTE